MTDRQLRPEPIASINCRPFFFSLAREPTFSTQFGRREQPGKSSYLALQVRNAVQPPHSLLKFASPSGAPAMKLLVPFGRMSTPLQQLYISIVACIREYPGRAR